MVLPFHRRDRRRETRIAEKNAPATTDSKGKRFGRFVVDWIKVSWKDCLTLAILGAAALSIYSAPVAAVRNFPITFNGSGDIVYPQWAYPDRKWVISPLLSGILSVVVPLVVIALAQLRIRSFWDLNNAVLGLLYSVVLGSLFQVIIKQLIGGFRPYFLSVCQPDISLAQINNSTGLNAVGFHQIMYSVDVCTNPDKDALKNAMTSFPSGHATTSWAGYIFMFLWMNGKLKVWANFRASFYWLALLLVPLLGAVLMAAVLTVDQAHNWYDILAGMAIGTAMALMSYRISYAAIWDWRFNHIPLRHRRVLDYSAATTPEYMGRWVFVQKLGWGRKRVGRTRGTKRAGVGGVGSARSSATYARNGSGVSPHAHEPATGVRYPEAANVRGTAAYPPNGRIAGDEMV